MSLVEINGVEVSLREMGATLTQTQSFVLPDEWGVTITYGTEGDEMDISASRDDLIRWHEACLEKLKGERDAL